MTQAGPSRTPAEGDPGGAVLAVRDVTVRAGSRALLQGVGFEARAGELVAIIGPNGAGKTTLLEVLVGLRMAQAGSLVVRGRPVERFRERARLFAYLPDAGELPAELRAGEVVEHALRFRPRAPSLVVELRAALGIEELLGMPIGVMSRGELQRVSLFCALSVDRPVVVLDEPFGAFDPLRLRAVIHSVRLVAASGAAIVATIHHLGDATKVADRVLVLHEGRAVAWGALDELRAQAGVPEGSLEDVFVALLSRRSHAP